MKLIAYLLAIFISASHAMQPKTPLPPHFPKYPLTGLFRVVESRTEPPLPTLEQLSPNRYDQNLFFPNQLVRFSEPGEWGSDRPDWLSYEMTLYPPFNPGICRHVRFSAYCGAQKPTQPAIAIVQSMVAEFDRLTADMREDDSRLPLSRFGAKKGKYLHIVMYADKTGVFILYFQDWNTLINLGTYWEGGRLDEHGEPDRRPGAPTVSPKKVVQILKRVKE